MPRLTKEQIDEEILDAAAGLFARHGVEQTSVQRIADAVGYSKTGLLHRFASKEAIQEATITHTVAAFEEIAADVATLPVGRSRDQAVLEKLFDATVQRPGLVAFMLTGVSQGALSLEKLDALGEVIFRSFGVEFTPAGDDPSPDVLRGCVRITSAVCGLAMTKLAFSDLTPEFLRADLVRTALGALGHPTNEMEN